MGSGLILETTFLIDLEREALRSQPGVAHAFLVAHEDEPLFLTFVVVGELATGRAVSDDSRGQRATGCEGRPVRRSSEGALSGSALGIGRLQRSHSPRTRSIAPVAANFVTSSCTDAD